MVALIVWSQVTLIPILGALLVGIKAENDRKERILKTALRALGIVVTSRGRSRWGKS